MAWSPGHCWLCRAQRSAAAELGILGMRIRELSAFDDAKLQLVRKSTYKTNKRLSSLK